MDTTRQKIYLAALLHDIGKFYQRASNGYNKEGSNLSLQSKTISDYICPSKNNRGFSHQHVVWTNEFFEKFKNTFESIKEKDNLLFKINAWTDESKEDNLINLSVNHHRPASELQAIIQMADWWSSGIDRRKHEHKEDDTENNVFNLKFKSFKHVPFFSIYNNLEIKGKKGNLHTAYIPQKLQINDLKPKLIKQDNVKDLNDDYSKLWEDFEKELSSPNFPTDSFSGFEETLVSLLKKYTWAIPADTTSMANVSLFEHSKTTAAFADCLYTFYKEQKDAFEFDTNKKSLQLKANKYPVLLAGFDISGIQSFIYDIASSKAAKSLKGRSFYLQLLVESIIQRLYNDEKIQAKSANILYSSGGKFYLLLPNIKSVSNALENLNLEIENELWEQHKGKLLVNMAYQAFAYRTEFNEGQYKLKIELEGINNNSDSLGDLWKSLANKITQKKEQKFKNQITSDFDNFFGNGEKLKVGGDVEVCIVTGEELIKKSKLNDHVLLKEKKVEIFNREDVENNKVSPQYTSKIVFEQTELGNALKDADYIITFKDLKQESSYLNGKSKAKITVLNVDYYLFDKLEIISDKAEFREITSADVSRVRRINNNDFLATPLKGQKVSYGTLLYGGNQQAIKNDKKAKTFQDIAKTENGSNSLLGILRMDIDNLGNLFIKGLKNEDKSFSAYATMSYMLDLFFSGYLNTLRNSEKYKNWVNILYSGGDDLFVIGRWNEIIEFAEDVRTKFKEFVNRDDIGISGGICFVHEKFPIAKAANLAGEAEHASKEYPKEKPFDKKDKNALTFFGETVCWNTEFSEVKNYKELFVKYINKNGLSRGLLHKLMLFGELKKDNESFIEKDEKEKVDYRYVWNTAYYLKRFAERFKFDSQRMNEQDLKNKEIYEFIMGRNENGKHIGGLQENLFAEKRKYNIVSLAARWAEMDLKYQVC